MGIVRGLAGINRAAESQGDRPKIPFLKVNDGQTVKVRFLQELDPDSPNYNDKNGLGFLAIEHQAPADFKRRALCTADEGPCYGCEQYSKGVKGFRQKQKLYVNALVTTPDGESKVMVVSQGFGPKSVTPALIEAAGEYGSITNRVFKLKRTGAGQTDTSYTLTPLDRDEIAYDVTQHELVDLDKAVYNIPYDEQEEYFGTTFGQATPSDEGSGGGSSDTEVW